MAKHLSPGAQLLRGSRLFSVPPPLPRPQPDNETSSFYRRSETSTTHYPTHQAIVTPPSSLARGDWGLKRPLPSRLISKSSNPSIRVKGIDTIEHITDYASAGDHTRTLEKFQELGIALARREKKDSMARMFSPPSAFDSLVDNTTKESAESDWQASSLRDRPKRWKFTGPPVASLSEGEFSRFLKRELRLKRTAFLEFLKPRLWRRFLEDERGRATEQSKETVGDEAAMKLVEARFYQLIANMDEATFAAFLAKKSAVVGNLQAELRSFIMAQIFESPSELTSHAQAFEEQFRQAHQQKFEEYIKRWLHFERYDTTINSKLNTLIKEFLDMPQNPDLHDADLAAAGLPDPEPFMFSTHPSAGLSYLRTNNVLENHPLLGPQADKSPIQARVLQPRTVNKRVAILGVAGIATQEQTNPSGRGQYNESKVKELDPEVPGGSKAWVSVDDAWISSQGKVNLRVSYVQQIAENIRTNAVPNDPKATAVNGYQRAGRAIPLTSEELRSYPMAQFDKPLPSTNGRTTNASSTSEDAAIEAIRRANEENEETYRR